MGANDGAVEHQILVVAVGCQGGEHPFPHAGMAPAAKTPVHCLPMAITLQQVAPGWERVSRLGGNQKIIDLELREPILGTRACAQIKSRATQSVLDEYIRHFDAMKIWSCLFFICHEQLGPMSTHQRDDVHVWTGKVLAETVIRCGLNDWLLAKLV